MLQNLEYAIDEIRSKGDDPHWWRQRFLSNVVGPVVSAMHGNTGVDVMERDWDNLFVLDACRADAFQSVVDTGAFETYESIHSLGCSSPEWMHETFNGEEYPDTVCVSANPFISKIAPDSFHAVHNIWLQEFQSAGEDLADADSLGQLGPGIPTIPADTVNSVAREVHDDYPNKRLLVHYLQPHHPFIGHPDGTQKTPSERDEKLNPAKPLLRGERSRAEIWAAYIDNLRYVMVHADQLAESLGGRTAYTADHGELFGERLWPFPLRGVAHPDGVRHPALTQVPWAVREHGERREVVAGELSRHEADEDYLNDRLRDLGYTV
jgi:hypothetical protein